MLKKVILLNFGYFHDHQNFESFFPLADKKQKLLDNSSLKFEIMAKQLYVASQRVL